MAQILTFVTTEETRQLKSHFKGRHAFTTARTWEGFKAAMTEQPTNLALIDLAAIDSVDSAPTMRISLAPSVADRPHFPFLVRSAETSSDLFQRLLRLNNVTPLWRGIDDSVPELHRMIDRAANDHPAARVQAQLGNHLSRLTPGLRQAVDELFDSPADLRSADALAKAASLSRRSLYTSLATASLSPHELIQAARVIRAVWMTVCQGCALKRVVKHLGDESDRTLRRQIRRVTGVSHSRLRSQFDLDDFVRDALASVIQHEDLTKQPASTPRV